MTLFLISEGFQICQKLSKKPRFVFKKPLIKKIMRIGIVSIILFMTASMQLLFAYDLKSQTIDKVQINLGLNNETLVGAFKKIESQSSFHFMYRKEEVKQIQNLNLAASQKSVEEFLKILLANTSLTFRQVNDQILIMPSKASANVSAPGKLFEVSKVKAISGTITNARGEPLAGVSITIKGTNVGTSSNASGNYSINADENNILVFSYVGFNTQEITVTAQNTINVRLQEESTALNEVVVTALGIKKEKRALTYAVSEVGGEDLTKARELNLGNALSGRVAGVTASGTSGGPAASSRVIIRGNGSLNGDNQPLYVINGIPITNTNTASAGTYGGIDRGDGLSSLNPDDIETVTVLKGGTAAALYGSRAANGVILITTKSGKMQKGIGIQFNSNYTNEKAIDLLDWQYQYGSGAGGVAPTSQGEAVAFGRTSWGAKLDGSQVIQPDGEMHSYTAQENNVENFYQTGSTFANTIAFNGGNEIANFRFSASNMDNKGIVPNNSFNRKTFNLSMNANLAKKLVFEGNAQYSTEEVKNRTYLADFQLNPNAGAQLIATNIDVRSLDPGYLPNGNEMPWSDYIYATNPYFAVNKIKNGDNRKRFIGSFTTRYNITESFYARARFGIDQVNLDGYAIQPTGTAFNNRGQINTDKSLQVETNLEGSIGYNKDFGNFSVNIFAGGNQMRSTFDGINLSSGQLNLPFQYFIGNGSSQTFGQNFSELGINSLFASADIDFKKYLYLTVSGRNDWFSTLDKSKNNLFYPSVGLSFVASDAWNNKPVWMDYAKVRASWAQVGGGAPSPYAISQTYSAQSIPYFGQSLMTVTSATIPSLLTPYTSTTKEAGVELRIFRNRLGLDVTVYDRTTTNDIVNAAIPPSSGYNNVALNVGKIQNRGIEVMLSGTPVKAKTGFKWDVALNLAYNKNDVIKIAEGLTALQLPGAVTRTLNGWIYHFEGQPFGMIAGFKQKTDDKGQLVFNSSSGLPIAGPLVTLGRGVPPLTLGLNNNFSFKNFNLSFLIDSRWGASIYSATNAYGTDFGLNKRTVDNNVRETGVAVSGVDENGNPFSATIPAEKYYRGTAYTITGNFVEKADFIKLRSFTLGYNLPSNLLNGTPFQSASLAIVGRNLLLLYNAADNIDPESNYNNSNAQGLENFGLPTTRSYGVNLSVRF